MKDSDQGLLLKNRKRLKILLVILLPLLAIGCIFLLSSPNENLFLPGVFILILFFMDVGVSLALLTKKYYNWTLVFISLVIVAIVFKHQRWPFSGAAFAIGFGGLGSFSLFSSFAFLSRYRHIPFLRYIGFSSSLVLSVVSVGLLWKNMHWPFAGFMINIGLITFIPFLFAFVFTLPNANFVNWNKNDRAVFFRAIIIPMIFVYVISVMMFVFPDFWNSIIRSHPFPFGMDHIDLIQKAGLH